jgi:hypothetical protein
MGRRISAVLALLLWCVGAARAQDVKPLALHPENPHYFLFRGKTTVLVGSTEHYGAVMNLDFDYVKYLDELARHGLNLTRTFSGTYREIPDSFGITDNTLSPKNYIGPWAADAAGKFDLTKYDGKYFERLKAFVSEASKRGVVVEYVLFCTLYNDALWNINPMNPKNHASAIGGDVPRREVCTLKHPELVKFQEAFVRKAVTELNGFDNVYFEICNEPYFEGVALDWQARIAQVIVETEKGLANRHLIAQNIANNKQKVDGVTPGVSILNFHYARPPETVEMNYKHKVAIADDETGFDGKADVNYRTEGWDFLVAGGAAYDNLDYSFTAKHPAGTFKEFKSPGGGGDELRRSLGAARRFMEGFELVKMKPMNGAIRGGKGRVVLTKPTKGDGAPKGQMTARALAEEGNAYAVYLNGGAGPAELVMELPAGTYKAEWVNPRDGAITQTSSFDHGGGEKTLASPAYEEDVALKITRAR